MFENKTLFDIFRMGGWVMYVLLACSVMSLGVFIGKEFEFWKKSKPSRITVMKNIRGFLEKKDIDSAIKYCMTFSYSSFCTIVAAGLKATSKNVIPVKTGIYN
ncbi:MAG TPA: hypothetical protein VMX95_06805 [Thermodesulfobacteriota bacterium]|nr:hypothetical protein [Thermodesulfobacteriota bacterium]